MAADHVPLCRWKKPPAGLWKELMFAKEEGLALGDHGDLRSQRESASPRQTRSSGSPACTGREARSNGFCGPPRGKPPVGWAPRTGLPPTQGSSNCWIWSAVRGPAAAGAPPGTTGGGTAWPSRMCSPPQKTGLWSLEPAPPQTGGGCRPCGRVGVTARLLLLALVGASLGGQCIPRAAGAAWRAGWRLAFSLGVP